MKETKYWYVSYTYKNTKCHDDGEKPFYSDVVIDTHPLDWIMEEVIGNHIFITILNTIEISREQYKKYERVLSLGACWR